MGRSAAQLLSKAVRDRTKDAGGVRDDFLAAAYIRNELNMAATVKEMNISQKVFKYRLTTKGFKEALKHAMAGAMKVPAGIKFDKKYVVETLAEMTRTSVTDFLNADGSPLTTEEIKALPRGTQLALRSITTNRVEKEAKDGTKVSYTTTHVVLNEMKGHWELCMRAAKILDNDDVLAVGLLSALQSAMEREQRMRSVIATIPATQQITGPS